MEKRLDNFGLTPAEISAVEKQIADLKVSIDISRSFFRVWKSHMNMYIE